MSESNGTLIAELPSPQLPVPEASTDTRLTTHVLVAGLFVFGIGIGAPKRHPGFPGYSGLFTPAMLAHGDPPAAKMHGQADAHVPHEIRIRVEEVDLRPHTPELALDPCRLIPRQPAAGHLGGEEAVQLVAHTERRVGEEERAVGAERIDAVEERPHLALDDLARRCRLGLDVEHLALGARHHVVVAAVRSPVEAETRGRRAAEFACEDLGYVPLE